MPAGLTAPMCPRGAQSVETPTWPTTAPTSCQNRVIVDMLRFSVSLSVESMHSGVKARRCLRLRNGTRRVARPQTSAFRTQLSFNDARFNIEG